jgi:hypothetical protein
MISELRYLLKTNSDCEACSDQESLCVLLIDLRAVADNLHLDFARALLHAKPHHDVDDQSSLGASILIFWKLPE